MKVKILMINYTFRPSAKTNVVNVIVYNQPNFSLTAQKEEFSQVFREWILSGFEITPTRLNDIYIPFFMTCDTVRCAFIIDGNDEFNNFSRRDREISLTLSEIISKDELKQSILKRITNCDLIEIKCNSVKDIYLDDFVCGKFGEEFVASIENNFNDEFWHLLDRPIQCRCEKFTFKDLTGFVRCRDGKVQTQSFNWAALLDFDAFVVTKGAKPLSSSVAIIKSRFKGSFLKPNQQHFIKIHKNNRMSVLLGFDKTYNVELYDLLPNDFYYDLTKEFILHEKRSRDNDETRQKLYLLWDSSGVVSLKEIRYYEFQKFNEFVKSISK